MKNHTICRVCGNEHLIPYLDLGMMPLSNNLASSVIDPIHYEKYPLKVLFCDQCGLSQLSVVIDPEKLFGHYVYRSSISQGYKDHCHNMAVDLKERFHLDTNSLHVDIAGNDGALLLEFKKIIAGEILNVDPAENLKGVCMAADIPTFTAFWGIETAKIVKNSKYGLADLITATNVFAHIDNVKEFLQATKLLLKPDGHLVLEFPYLIDFIEKKEFDTVYFEHLSYFPIYPITILCKQVGLEVLRVEKHDIHGGSVRVIIGQGAPDETVGEFLEHEEKYRTIEPYLEFAEDAKKTIHNLFSNLINLEGSIAAFAASAKGNTLLNTAQISLGTLRYIVDETPEKIGKYSPGTFLPIVSMHDLMRMPPDYLLILSWNFAEEIMNKCKKAGYKGKFIIPIPEFKIVENTLYASQTA